ncbi:histidine phosphatase family protein [Abyssisolibacter fermentans]|uniref:histidine phosphatase family protein n=1 Tax=Abyssisolibacter fermentans TaxID=1766203 RepID=UPI000836F595|nr:histidine phosphatase family protein [Abyssisolibacter fermentans]
MKLILVRHVETVANFEQRYIGHIKSEITEKGMKQLEALVSKLDELDFDSIYTSPMPRARIIGQRINRKIPIIEDGRLKEMNFGVFEGLNFKEAQNKHKAVWNEWTKDYINYKLPKGESLIQVQERVKDFIKSLDDNGTYLIITHGGIIHCLLTYLLDLDIDKRWHFKIGLGAVIELEYNNGYGIMLSMTKGEFNE